MFKHAVDRRDFADNTSIKHVFQIDESVYKIWLQNQLLLFQTKTFAQHPANGFMENLIIRIIQKLLQRPAVVFIREQSASVSIGFQRDDIHAVRLKIRNNAFPQLCKNSKPSQINVAPVTPGDLRGTGLPALVSFPVRISIQGIDRVGLLNEISRYISLVMGVNIRHLTLSADQGIFGGYFDVYVNSKDVLDRMVRKLSSIEGIQSVIRTDLKA